MPELTILNSQLVPAQRLLIPLATQPVDVPVDVKWASVKLAQKLEGLIKLLVVAEKDLTLKYAQQDDKGNLIPFIGEDGKPVIDTWLFKEDADKGAFTEEYNKLMSAPNSIIGEYISLAKLNNFAINGNKPTGVDLLVLEFALVA